MHRHTTRSGGPRMRRVWPVALVALLVAGATPAQAKDNVSIQGNLVSEPCTLDSASITLDFGDLDKKSFWQVARTPGAAFAIKLLGCDTRVGHDARVTFSGTESSGLPGLLAPDGKTDPGVAIGIETSDGRPVPLNKPGPVYPLTDGTNTLTLKGYVAAEPEAIKKQSIVSGAFTATATFEIEYP